MKAVIFHGTKGSPEANWFLWLKTKLEKKRWDVHVPTLPTPDNQSPESWLEAAKSQVDDCSQTDVLIGHSLGGTFGLRLLESGLCKAKQIVLVSCVINKINIPEYDNLNAPFIAQPFYWETIRQNAEKFILLHGDNDPYVPVKHAEELGKRLRISPSLIKNGGHLNDESGYTEFPLLFELLNSA